MMGVGGWSGTVANMLSGTVAANMAKELDDYCLFVGGELDGNWLRVDPPQDVVESKAPRPTAFDILTAGQPYELATRQLGSERYRRQVYSYKVYPGDVKIVIYVIEGHGSMDMIEIVNAHVRNRLAFLRGES